jgi:pilus assembly protein Flp/PilA
MKATLIKFLRDEQGLTTVEYAIAGGLVGAGVIFAFSELGEEVARVITDITTALTNVTINTGAPAP